jgi:hypothetical protein
MNALREVKSNSCPIIGINDTKEDEDLIRNDRVTCVLYYKHRMNALCQLVSHDYKYLGELEDQSFFIEFENRGSQHSHGLSWVNNVPI